MFGRDSYKHEDIDFENVLFDSKNVSDMNTEQMEGVFEQPISKRSFWLLFAMLSVMVLVFSGRLFWLQVVHGQDYVERSQNNTLRHQVLFNKRGVIYDRRGTELAWNESDPSSDFALRRYASSSGFSHLLGFVTYPQQDRAGRYYEYQYTGKSGLERIYDEQLNGTLGTAVVEADALGRVISQHAVEQPVAGQNIQISVDARVQTKLYELLQEFMTERDFSGAAAAIMDVRSGELIAMVSAPEYDSNILTAGQDKQTIASYNVDEAKPFLNRMTQGEYAPGSIVKPFVAAGVLAEDLISPDYRLVTDGVLEVESQYVPGEYTYFRDYANLGIVNMYDAMAKSSNIYFMTFGGGWKHKGLGIDGLNKYFRLFGMGEKTGLDGFSEQIGVVSNPEWKKFAFGEDWLLGDTFYTAIGQYGSLMTPLQALTAVAAVANDGILLEPQLLRSGGRVEPRFRRDIPISGEDFATVKLAMRQVVLRGTAQSLNLPFVQVAAKTGTAERGVDRARVNSWAIGFWPYTDPQYAFVVMADDGPRENQYTVSRNISALLRWMKEEGIEDYFD